METYMFLSSKCHIPRSNLNLKRAQRAAAVETQELQGASPPRPTPTRGVAPGPHRALKRAPGLPTVSVPISSFGNLAGMSVLLETNFKYAREL